MWNAPDYMYRMPLSVLLNSQDTWPFLVGWVVLQNLGIKSPGHDLPNSDTIRCQFIIAVFRDPNLPMKEQSKYFVPSRTPEETLTYCSIFSKLA